MDDGADEVEAYASQTYEVQSFLENNGMKLGKRHKKNGLGIRVFTGKSLGFSSVNDLSKESVDRAVQNALKISKSSPSDSANILPEASSIRMLSGIYDRKAEEFSAEDSLKKAVEMLHTALEFDHRVSVDSGAFNAVVAEHVITNTNGIALEEKMSIFSWAIMGMAVDGEDVSNFDFQFGGSHFVKDIDVVSSAKEFAENVVKSLGSKKCESFRGSIILSPNAVQELFIEPIAFSVSSKNIQKSMSRFAGKIDGEIASPILTIVDDGTFVDGLAASSFDREGVQHSPITLIDQGTLKSYIYNTYTANKDGLKSTGHASGDTRSPPSVSTTNILLKEGDRGRDQLIAEIEKGVVVTRFSGNVSPISGDFSGVVKGGFLVKNGNIIHPIRETLISGNIFDLIKRISAASKERKKFFNSILPYISVEDVSITGG